MLTELLERLWKQESVARKSFCFIPSENVLSPLARVPLVLDGYSRYYFDHKELLGEWLFFGGLELGAIQNNCLIPLLKRSCNAGHVETRTLSGLNCMTIVMAALAKSGGTIMTIPERHGGHMSSHMVASRLGITPLELPMADHEIDLDAFEAQVVSVKPDLIYLDHSIQLFPINPGPLRGVLERHGLDAYLHYDSSHLNGLIVTGAIPNPLNEGATSFGGSTHKTLPGPHKSFVATNLENVRKSVADIAYHFVSHQQSSLNVSLAITLLELEQCGGKEYGKKVIENARLFARLLDQAGIPVAGKRMGFTGCHQVWALATQGNDSKSVACEMYNAGLIVNKLPFLPELGGPAFRFSLAEVTRMGADSSHIEQFAALFADLLDGRPACDKTRGAVSDLKERLPAPRYCFELEDLVERNVPEQIIELFQALSHTGQT